MGSGPLSGYPRWFSPGRLSRRVPDRSQIGAPVPFELLPGEPCRYPRTEFRFIAKQLPSVKAGVASTVVS